MHADNGLDIQEFMIAPIGAPTFREALRMAAEVFHNLKSILKSKKLATSVGDEGGFAPVLANNEEAITLILEAIAKAGYKAGKDIFLALDVAASSIYKDSKYTYDGRQIGSGELTAIYSDMIKRFPVVSIEDGLDENDWDGWQELTKQIGKDVQLVGDDLL